MPKRRPSTAIEPLDIFSSPRLSNAMAAATSPEPLAQTAPEPVLPASPEVPEEQRFAPLRSVSAPPEAHREAPKTDAFVAPEPPARSTPAKGRRGKAEPVEEPESELVLEPNVPLKFRVPQTLRSEFQTFKAELSAALGGVALDDSNLGRPLLEHFLVEQRERILEAAAAFKGRLRRPANGDAVAMAEFDHSLGEIFSEARRRRRASPSAGSEA
jgi:hypothetical protein